MRRCVVLLGMAALAAAMLGRAGFVDWERVLAVALVAGGVALVVGAFVLAVAAGAALAMAPVLLLVWGTVRLLRLWRGTPPAGKGPASATQEPRHAMAER